MKSTLIRTAMVTSLVTALGISALAYYAFPRFAPSEPASAQFAERSENGVTVPALYHGPVQSYDPSQPRVIRRSSSSYSPPRSYAQPRNTYSGPRDQYGEPIRQQGRSTGKSALIVAGSAGTGAAIGALAGGGKGAAIGALAGGAAGFIYDRMTAHH
jgi:hypothetical protein